MAPSGVMASCSTGSVWPRRTMDSPDSQSSTTISNAPAAARYRPLDDTATANGIFKYLDHAHGRNRPRLGRSRSPLDLIVSHEEMGRSLDPDRFTAVAGNGGPERRRVDPGTNRTDRAIETQTGIPEESRFAARRVAVIRSRLRHGASCRFARAVPNRGLQKSGTTSP